MLENRGYASLAGELYDQSGQCCCKVDCGQFVTVPTDAVEELL